MHEQLRCPSCNKKLFEIEFYHLVDINIKCPRCKNTIHIHLNNIDDLRIAEVQGGEKL